MIRQILTIAFIIGLFSASCKEVKNTDNKTGVSQSKPEIKTETTSNKESFKSIDDSTIVKLNQTIAAQKLKIEEEIMNLYRTKSNETEGNYTYSVTKKDIDKNTKEITLIEDGMLDDSQAGLKVIMILRNENNVVKIVSIKENYKCWKNRGHENWSAELCI